MPTETILAWVKDLHGIRLGRTGPEFSPEALRTLLENLPVAVSITSGPEHRFVYANRLYRHVLTPHLGDPFGRTVAEVFGDLYSPEHASLRDKILATGEPSSLREVPIKFASASREVYWDVSQIAIIGESGKAEGILMLGIEVTEKVVSRREAEANAAEADLRAREAQHERQRLELAAEAADLGIWEWEPERGHLHWSYRQKEIWGLPPDRPASYEDWENALHPDDRDSVLQMVQAVHDPASGGRLAMEHRILRTDGTVRWISGRARMLYDPASGKPTRLIGTSRDITNRKRALEELRLALAAKETLLREVNHRVKNSLTLVSSMLSLQSRSLNDERLRQQVDEARWRIQTVARVHERLYHSTDADSVELDAYVGGLCEDLGRSGIGPSVRISCTADPVKMSNDRAVPVALVLNELVTNALKHAYPGGEGTIEVELRRVSPAEMRLTVGDSGDGLPLDFEARRAGSLGFRIIDGLTRQLNGRLEVNKRERGAEFALIFPVSRAAEDRIGTSRPEEAA